VAHDQPVEARFQQPPTLSGFLELGVDVTQPGDAAQRAVDVNVPRVARLDLASTTARSARAAARSALSCCFRAANSSLPISRSSTS
jgi:hypothetical protein